jgi:hypothetical protein
MHWFIIWNRVNTDKVGKFLNNMSEYKFLKNYAPLN